MSSFVCRATNTAYKLVSPNTSPNTYLLTLIPPTQLLDCDAFCYGSPPEKTVGKSIGDQNHANVSQHSTTNTVAMHPTKPMSPLISISHSGFTITAADEMYHTVWENYEGWQPILLSPLFKDAVVKKVIPENWDTFEVGDPLLCIQGELVG